MNRNKLAIIIGVLVLAIALYFGFKANPSKELTEKSTTVASGQIMTKSVSARNTSPQRTGASLPENRSSGIVTEQASAEISRLLQDETIPMRQACEKLLAMAADRNISKEMRCESLAHGLNLVDDQDYASLVQPYIDQNYFEENTMQRTVLDDAYNRDDLAKLPAAHAIFASANEELRNEAQELMAFVMDREAETLGGNNDAWLQAIREHLSKREQELEELPEE